MGDWRRYAIYYTPAGPLAVFGARWLGWDIAAGKAIDVKQPHVEALTRSPRRYGFHATLKAPFRLAPDSDQESLLSDLRALAADQPAIALEGGLRLASLDGFPALIPARPDAALQDLAARVVRDLDRHRAPLTAEDRARRNPERLSQPQRNLLDRWGYPFVMGQFRFHMTLGGRLPPARIEAVIGALNPHLAPLLPAPQPIDALTLVGEDSLGRFHQIARLPLVAAPDSAPHSG